MVGKSRKSDLRYVLKHEADYVQDLPPLVRSFRRLVSGRHPFTITALMGCAGMMQTGIPLSKALIGMTLGTCVDTARLLLARRYVNRHQRHSDLAQVVGIRYIDAMADTLRRWNGYEGEFTLTEDIREESGNSLFAAGYLTRCTFTFDEEGGPQEHKFVFKYSEQGEAELASGRAIQMNDLGYDCFVPPVFPTELELPIEDGVLYEDRGESLEELYYGDVQLLIDPDTNPANNLPDVFASDLRYVYNDESDLPERSTVYFDSMFRIPVHFETGKLEKFAQKNKVLKRLNNLDSENDLHDVLDEHHTTTFQGLRLSKIHGDLKPGNVLDNGVKLAFIDTDQINLDVADMDRAHFDVRSDFAHTDGYQGHRAELLDHFGRNNPNLRRYHQDMNEGLVYLNKLLHFTESQSLNDDPAVQDPETAALRQDLKQVCKFMLERTRECFAAYEQQMREDESPTYADIKQKSLVEALDQYAEDNFGFLEGVETTGLESMAYAEWVDRQLKRADNPTQRQNLDMSQQDTVQFMYLDKLTDTYCFIIPTVSFLPAITDAVFYSIGLMQGDLSPQAYQNILMSVADQKLRWEGVAASAGTIAVYQKDNWYKVAKNVAAVKVAADRALLDRYESSDLKPVVDSCKQTISNTYQKVKSIFTPNNNPEEQLAN